MDWWMARLLQDSPATLISWIVIVIGSIVLHELAHGWAAIRCGDRTPRELGHMTWNPLVHMGPWSLLAFAVVGIAWGAMPVNPSRFQRWDDRAFVAAAGPGMNLALALVAIVAGGVSIVALPAGNAADVVVHFFYLAAMLNLALMILNLLPIPPLDGWAILSTYFPAYGRLFGGPQGMVLSLGLVVVLVMFGGKILFGPAQIVALRGTEAVVRVLS